MLVEIMDDLILKQRIVNSTPLLEFNEDEKYTLTNYCKKWDQNPNSKILGDTGLEDGVILLTKGIVEISIDLESGNEVIVPEFSDGFIGEIGYFNGKPNRSSNVIALTQCEGLYFPSEDGNNLREDNAKLARKFEYCLFKSLSEKLQITNRRLLLLRHDYNLVLKKVEEFPGIQEARQMVDDVLAQILSPDMTEIIQKANQVPKHMWDKVLDYVEVLKKEEELNK